MNKKAVITITGGGSFCFHDILAGGGKSPYFIEGNIPYSIEAIDDFLGYKLNKYCSEKAARALAVASYERCVKLTGNEDVEGYGVTAKLIKENEREGREHAAWIAVHTKYHTATHRINFETSMRTRIEQETWLGNKISKKVQKIEESWDRTAMYNFDSYVVFGGDLNNQLIFPGSFNPVHDGHIEIAKMASEKTGKKVLFEISITNERKPRIDYIDAYDRITNILCLKTKYDFISGIILSRLPKFLQKYKAYGVDAEFIAGTDTMAALDIRDTILPNKFHVFDRKGFQYNTAQPNVEYYSYKDIKGLSSTQIREQNGKT